MLHSPLRVAPNEMGGRYFPVRVISLEGVSIPLNIQNKICSKYSVFFFCLFVCFFFIENNLIFHVNGLLGR